MTIAEVAKVAVRSYIGRNWVVERLLIRICRCQSFEHAQRLAATDFDRRLVAMVF